MDILMVSRELGPYTGTGVAGESVASLGRALVQLGHVVTVALPREPGVEQAGVMVARRLTPLQLGDGRTATLYDGQLPSGVRVVLFEAPELKPYEEIADNREALASWCGTLCCAAAALGEQRAAQGNGFSVAHLHGWVTAPTAVRSQLPCLFTFYDATERGAFLEQDASSLGIPEAPELLSRFRLGEHGIDLLKGGLLSARLSTTVSPSTAAQTLEKDLSGAIGAALSAGGIEILGVVPGVDYALYNPATDAALPTRFDAESSELKASCKLALYRELELESEPDLPLVVFAGPLSESAGADLVALAAAQLCRSPINVVIAGQGQQAIEKALSSARLTKLQNYRFIAKGSVEQQRRLLAAADVALCPQRDVSVLPIRVAQRYGAIPVALSTPLARDCIVDCPSDLATGTGFLFEEPTLESLLGGVGRALSACHSPSFRRLVRRVLRLDLSWDRPARRYAQLYRMIASAVPAS